MTALDVREFWTPTRPLFDRKRLTDYESYTLLPGDLLSHDPDTGVWTKVAPGAVVEDVRVDVFLDNLQAVRVNWFLDTAVAAFVWLPSEVDIEAANARLTAAGDPPLTRPLPVPEWPVPEVPEYPPFRPWGWRW